MNDFLQSGLHPDADQISAFAEGALSAHERDRVLGHLALCPRCRAVVALALPPANEPAQPLPAKLRWENWFTVRNLAWTTAAALAATVVFTVYVYRAATTRNRQAPVAIARPAAPAYSNEAAITRPANSQLARQAPRNTSSAAIASSAAPTETHPPASLSRSNELEAAAPVSAQPAVSGFGSGEAQAGGIGAASSADRKILIGGGLASPFQAEPAPQASVALAATGSDTVRRTGAAAAEVLAREQLKEEPHPELQSPRILLPSGLPVVSQAAQGSLMLAIDANHAVFFSEDAGRRWKPVPAPWQGRAVKAALISSRELRRPGGERLTMEVAGTDAGAIFSVKSPSAGTAEGSLSGVVTDANGAAVPGAKVTATSNANDVTSSTTTSGLGAYSLPQLAVGTYTVRVSAPGFKVFATTGVEIHVSTNTGLNAVLALGAVSEKVTVQADEVQVETTSAEVGEVITGSQLRELPLNSENVVSLTPISPGVNAATKPAAKTAAPNQSAALPPPVFEIVTDGGENWVSADGLTWTRR